MVCFTNLNLTLFNYQLQTKQAFSSYKNVSSVTELWKWISNDFLVNVKINTIKYNFSMRQSYTNIELFMSDMSSVVVGYPILRQLRVKKGKYPLKYRKKSVFNP